MKWCSRRTWWRLIPAKPSLSSAECQLSRESSQGLWLRFVAWAAKNTRFPPPTHCSRHIHTNTPPTACLPACCSDWQKLKLFHGFFYPLGGISRPICWLSTEHQGEMGVGFRVRSGAPSGWRLGTVSSHDFFLRRCVDMEWTSGLEEFAVERSHINSVSVRLVVLKVASEVRDFTTSYIKMSL